MEAEAEYFLTAVSDSHLVVSEKPKTLLPSPVASPNRVFQVSFASAMMLL